MKGISKRHPSGILPAGDDKVTISSEYYGNEKPSFICNICNQTLVRLTDAGMNNQTYWCRNCSIEWDPALENIRRDSKLSVPNRNEETLIAQTPGQEYLNKQIEVKHEQEIKGSFKELQKKGLKITHYEEHIPK